MPLGRVEKALIAANVYDKSNEVYKQKGIIDTMNIMTARDWVSNPMNRARFNISQEFQDSKNLDRVYMVPFEIGVPGKSETIKLTLVVDSHCRDCAILGLDGPDSYRTAKRVTDKIGDNAKLLDGEISPELISNLKLDLEQDVPKDMEELFNEFDSHDGEYDIASRSRPEVEDIADRGIKKRNEATKEGPASLEKAKEEKASTKDRTAIGKLNETSRMYIQQQLPEGYDIDNIIGITVVQSGRSMNGQTGLTKEELPEGQLYIIKLRNNDITNPTIMLPVDMSGSQPRLLPNYDKGNTQDELENFVARHNPNGDGEITPEEAHRDSDYSTYVDQAKRDQYGNLIKLSYTGGADLSPEEQLMFENELGKLESLRKEQIQKDLDAIHALQDEIDNTPMGPRRILLQGELALKNQEYEHDCGFWYGAFVDLAGEYGVHEQDIAIDNVPLSKSVYGDSDVQRSAYETEMARKADEPEIEGGRTFEPGNGHSHS